MSVSLASSAAAAIVTGWFRFAPAASALATGASFTAATLTETAALLESAPSVVV